MPIRARGIRIFNIWLIRWPESAKNPIITPYPNTSTSAGVGTCSASISRAASSAKTSNSVATAHPYPKSGKNTKLSRGPARSARRSTGSWRNIWPRRSLPQNRRKRAKSMPPTAGHSPARKPNPATCSARSTPNASPPARSRQWDRAGTGSHRNSDVFRNRLGRSGWRAVHPGQAALSLRRRPPRAI
jgi:hypothetical protein